MQELFFRKVRDTLSAERLGSYGAQDDADDCVLLARYLWNMSVCESLYSPLQIAEVGLRNMISQRLSEKYGELWFHKAPISRYQQENIDNAIIKLKRSRKSLSPGAIVAELSFGFWTSFFNKRHSRSGLGHYLAKSFVHAPKSQRDMKQLEQNWDRVRVMRNRVFHHERIIHWKDLNDKHEKLLELIRWISPELHEMTLALDRFSVIRAEGIDPWIIKVSEHWPED